MQTHFHPISGATIQGVRLPPGAILREGDFFAASKGYWQPCFSPGVILGSLARTVWVRPTDISKDSLAILQHLVTSHYPNAAVAERHGSYFFIPSPGWNWDGFEPLNELEHPGCLKELMEFGFLMLGEHAVVDGGTGHATIAAGQSNLAYTLTEAGRQRAASIH